MSNRERGTWNAERGTKGRARLLVLALFAVLPAANGCRQKMADQPYYRPLDYSDSFLDKRSARPLERGVVHRGQHLETDPLVTGLTAEEWAGYYKHAAETADPKGPKVDHKLSPDELNEANRKIAFGAPRFDQRGGGPKVYVEEFPFPIGPEELKRGQDRYSIFCAVCHGPLGNGQGKIWERGYLTPTSFHTNKVDPNEVDIRMPPGLGISRGYALWNPTSQNPVTMREAPVGYYFEVITRGFGGMPSYSAQIPPADRWKIIAYIRILQMTQNAGANLPPEVKSRLDAGGKP
jgi:hypothetical protein